ncbi:MAG: PEP-CTERM sorting domain-containing protein [Phycisphaerae bacterium]
MPRIPRLLLVLLLMPAALVRAQGAGVVVDHPPSQAGGPAADTEYLNSFGDQRWQLLADDIFLSSLATIRQVKWWGFYDQDNPPASESFRVRFYDARPSDGLPGNILFEEAFLNPSRTMTGEIISVGIGPHEYFYEVDLVTPFAADASTPYWIEVTQLGDVSTLFRWETSAADLSGFAFMNTDFADWTDPGAVSDLAFQLSTIPEPSTVLLLMIGMPCLFRRSVGRRRPWRGLSSRILGHAPRR